MIGDNLINRITAAGRGLSLDLFDDGFGYRDYHFTPDDTDRAYYVISVINVHANDHEIRLGHVSRSSDSTVHRSYLADTIDPYASPEALRSIIETLITATEV